MDIATTIDGHLADLAERYDCHILLASESGSRAWGLPSPDSDYDVRFIYAHATRWYLSIEDRHETIETVFPDDIDVSGRELRKALRLFSTCHVSLNEQIQSPIVYQANPKLLQRLRELIPTYFDKKRAIFHYVKIAEQAMNQGMQGLTIGLNRFFYLLRPLLACCWIDAKDAMPPTEFDRLLDADFLTLAMRHEVVEIVHRKAETTDREAIQLSKELLYWCTESLARFQDELRVLPNKETPPSLVPLNELFLNCISEMESEPAPA